MEHTTAGILGHTVQKLPVGASSEVVALLMVTVDNNFVGMMVHNWLDRVRGMLVEWVGV